MVLIFDGLIFHNGNYNYLSTRHNSNKLCNLLFADGHADSFSAGQLPTSNASFYAPGGIPQMAVRHTLMTLTPPSPGVPSEGERTIMQWIATIGAALLRGMAWMCATAIATDTPSLRLAALSLHLPLDQSPSEDCGEVHPRGR